MCLPGGSERKGGKRRRGAAAWWLAHRARAASSSPKMKRLTTAAVCARCPHAARARARAKTKHSSKWGRGGSTKPLVVWAGREKGEVELCRAPLASEKNKRGRARVRSRARPHKKRTREGCRRGGTRGRHTHPKRFHAHIHAQPKRSSSTEGGAKCDAEGYSAVHVCVVFLSLSV